MCSSGCLLPLLLHALSPCKSNHSTLPCSGCWLLSHFEIATCWVLAGLSQLLSRRGRRPPWICLPNLCPPALRAALTGGTCPRTTSGLKEMHKVSFANDPDRQCKQLVTNKDNSKSSNIYCQSHCTAASGQALHVYETQNPWRKRPCHLSRLIVLVEEAE